MYAGHHRTRNPRRVPNLPRWAPAAEPPPPYAHVRQGSARGALRARAAWWGLGVALLAACGTETTPEPTKVDLGPESSPEQRAALVVFDDTSVHDVQIVMEPADWQSILDDSRGDEWRRATISVDGVVVANVGIHPAGESSRVAGNPKMSMRVQFDQFTAGVKLGGFDTIKLSGPWDDPFVARDRLAYWYLRHMMPAPRAVAALLTVNGESRGVYEIEERWGRESLNAYFQKPYGPLYRVRGSVGADPFQYKGLDPSAYMPLPWDPIGDHPDDDHQVIGGMLRVLAEDPGSLGQVVDLDTLMSYFAGNALLANTDGFTSDLEVDDFYEYFDPATGRFFILPWDADNVFGSINDSPQRHIFQNFEKSALTRLIRDTSLKERYLARMEEFMVKVPVSQVSAEAERIYAQIRDGLLRDPVKRFPIEQFDWNLRYLQDFAVARYASVRTQIAASRSSPAAAASLSADATPK